MKTFEVKGTTLEVAISQDITKLFNSADLASWSLKQPIQSGWNTEDIRKRTKLLDAFENKEVGETIELEDSQVSFLLAECKSIKWFVLHSCVTEYEDYLTELLK